MMNRMVHYLAHVIMGVGLSMRAALIVWVMVTEPVNLVMFRPLTQAYAGKGS